jgi:thiosulfate dehydrogenase (quinone) large subunit
MTDPRARPTRCPHPSSSFPTESIAPDLEGGRLGNILTRRRIISDPPLAKFLFSDTRMAVVWLAVRLYVGYAWLDAGLHKVQDPAWVDTGLALKGFWLNVTKIPAPPAKPSITFDWYRSILQFLLDNTAYTWFGKLVAFGEVALGIALILGAFVGIAAAVGAFLNINYLLAGVASTNPVLLILAISLVLAWKTAGFVGLDRFLLPMLGTPWRTSEDTSPRARDRAPEGAAV